MLQARAAPGRVCHHLVSPYIPPPMMCKYHRSMQLFDGSLVVPSASTFVFSIDM